jgi:restriction system protein
MASNSRSNNPQRQIAAQLRAAEQAAKQAAREQAKAYEQRRMDQAAGMTAAAEQRIRELTGVLATALASPTPAVNFDTLKQRPANVPFELGVDAQPLPAPRWQDYEPSPPSAVGRLFGGDARYTRNRAAAESAFASACESHKAAEIARQQRVAKARQIHAQRQSAANDQAAKHNAAIDASRLPCRPAIGTRSAATSSS